ncbi:hypothetical protein CPC08DRAFT_726589 [Agrocybe pediades]|nr:hypothetical protein CPC08DRAFT_726589 [Agrocybe pediades]
MGKSWTTKPQLEWLQERRGMFLAAQRKRTRGRFVLHVHEEWQKIFPEEEVCFPMKLRDELTLEELAIVKKAKVARRKRLKWWFFWHSRSRKSMHGKGNLRLLDQFKKLIKSESTPMLRAPQPCEVYMKEIAKGKVDAAYNTISKEAKPSNAGQKVFLRHSIAKDLLSQEPQAIQDIVNATSECTLSGAEESQEAQDEDLTPEEYQMAINELPAFLMALIEPYLKAARLKGILMVSGPMLVDNGKIMTEVFHFGPESPTGLNFSQAHASFQADVADPFTKHAKECFHKFLLCVYYFIVELTIFLQIVAKAVRLARSMSNHGHFLPGGLQPEQDCGDKDPRQSHDILGPTSTASQSGTVHLEHCDISGTVSPTLSASLSAAAPTRPVSATPQSMPDAVHIEHNNVLGGMPTSSLGMGIPQLPGSAMLAPGLMDTSLWTPHGTGDAFSLGNQQTEDDSWMSDLSMSPFDFPSLPSYQATPDFNATEAPGQFEAWLAGKFSQPMDVIPPPVPVGSAYWSPQMAPAVSNLSTNFHWVNDSAAVGVHTASESTVQLHTTPTTRGALNNVGHVDYTLAGATFDTVFSDQQSDSPGSVGIQVNQHAQTVIQSGGLHSSVVDGQEGSHSATNDSYDHGTHSSTRAESNANVTQATVVCASKK